MSKYNALWEYVQKDGSPSSRRLNFRMTLLSSLAIAMSKLTGEDLDKEIAKVIKKSITEFIDNPDIQWNRFFVEKLKNIAPNTMISSLAG